MEATPENATITPEIQAQAEETFKLLQNKKLGEGVIPIDDVGLFYRQMGCNPSIAQLDEVKAYSDPEGVGTAKLPELMAGLEQLLQRPITEDQIQNAFGVFDKQGKGISLDELRYILTTLGEPMTPEEAEEMLAVIEEKCNTDENGMKTKLVAPTAFLANFLPQPAQ